MKKYVTAILLLIVVIIAVSASDFTSVLNLSFDNYNETYTRDSSSYASDGRISGATPVHGYNNTAYSFDGVDDYIAIGYMSHLFEDLDAGFTITAQIYPERSSENMTIVGYYGATNARNFQWYVDPQNKLAFLISNGDTYEILTDDRLRVNLSAWNSVAVTYMREGNVTLTVNEQTVTFTPEIDLVMFLRELYIGSICGGMADPFKGIIDEV